MFHSKSTGSRRCFSLVPLILLSVRSQRICRLSRRLKAANIKKKSAAAQAASSPDCGRFAPLHSEEEFCMTEEKETRKVDLAEAIRNKLEQKKQQSGANKGGFQSNQTKKLTTQNNKKPNNQRRRTGGS